MNCPAAAVLPQVLRVAKGNPEKLHEIVDTLTNHCIKVRHYHTLVLLMMGSTAACLGAHAIRPGANTCAVSWGSLQGLLTAP